MKFDRNKKNTRSNTVLETAVLTKVEPNKLIQINPDAKRLNQRYEDPKNKEKMSRFLKQYPSTQKILNQARSDLINLEDISNIV